MSIRSDAPAATTWSGPPLRPGRLIVALLLLAFALVPGAFGALTREMMVDAYVQVSAFVAATLLLFYGSERVFSYNIGDALSRARGAQVPLAGFGASDCDCEAHLTAFNAPPSLRGVEAALHAQHPDHAPIMQADVAALG